MRYVTAQEGVVISLGRQDENGVQTVIFPTSTWEETYGAGSFQLLNKRAEDTAPYPCDITVDDDGNVNWVVEAADVYYQGYGCVQITYVVDEAIAKSVIYSTSVLPSLGGGSVATGSWVERVYEIADEVTEALNESEENAESAEAWAVGQRAGVDVPETDETYHNNSLYCSQQSANSATESAGYATESNGYSEDSEAFATGKRNGVDVESGDEAYHNNAPYFVAQASGFADDAEDSADAAALSATQAASFVASPLVASTAAEMTDHTKIYVYTGSEAGYTSGHWYFWNGTAWADGGVYNATAVNIATSSDLQDALFA